MESELKKNQSDHLVFLGIFLFLLGLLVGFLVPVLANPRMALSSHLEGVMNGVFLVVLGLIWKRVHLSDSWLKITFWLAVYGTFVNWLGVLIGAIFNAGKMMSVAAEGQQGSPLVEGIVSFSLYSLSLAMLVVCIAVLIGLRKKRN